MVVDGWARGRPTTISASVLTVTGGGAPLGQSVDEEEFGGRSTAELPADDTRNSAE